jgi:hypothetical protein
MVDREEPGMITGVVVQPENQPLEVRESEAAYSLLRYAGELVDDGGTGIDGPVRGLIARYSPALILFADGSPGSDTPYPSGSHDYHPRSVEFHFPEVRSVALALVSLPRLLLLLLVFVVGSVGYAVAVFALLGQTVTTLLILLFGAILLYVVLAVIGVVLVARRPKGADAIRDRLAENMRDGLRDQVLTATIGPIGVRATHAWDRYCRRLTELPPGPDSQSVSYVRVIRGDRLASLALQFWFFYPFNHWWNVHEADWELVTLFFGDRCQEGGPPTAAAYSSHLGNRWRRWNDVRKLPGGAHPLVYVARGSHANYFEPRRGGYKATGAIPYIPWKMWLQLGGKSPSGREKDYVPLEAFGNGYRPPPITAETSYRIEAMPTDLEYVDPSDDPVIWKKWWWLRYRGKWGTEGIGALVGIDGPQAQASRWSAPFDWVSDDGQADVLWENAFNVGDIAPPQRRQKRGGVRRTSAARGSEPSNPSGAAEPQRASPSDGKPQVRRGSGIRGLPGSGAEAGSRNT